MADIRANAGMNTSVMLSIVISAVGFVVSVMASVFVAGTRWGQVRTEIEVLKNSQAHAATKEELAGVKESLAEIKGMFRLTIRQDGSSS